MNGQKFKIVPNFEITNSFYRAIAQAVGMDEAEYKGVRDEILHEIVKQWITFSADVCHYCGKSLSETQAMLEDPIKMVEKYKTIRAKTSAPYFELLAAALHFGFTFSVIQLKTSDQPITVKNCSNDRVLLKSTGKYHFLKTGTSMPYYEYLLPIG